MANYDIPDALKDRLDAVASKHKLGTAETLADQFVMDGLKGCDTAEGTMASQLEQLVIVQGYSSVAEAVEHLLLRGLQQYEQSSSTLEESEARVQGLGHID